MIILSNKHMMTMMIGILTIMGFQLIASPKMPSGTFSKLLSPQHSLWALSVQSHLW